MSQALYRTWRPHLWEEVVGQDHIVQTLKNAIAANKVGHAYLFAGPRGTGKTTSARLLAKAVNCLDPDPAKRPCDTCANCQAVNEGRFLDLIEIDAASNTSVDDVRELRDKVGFSPSQGTFKVYIIDEVHMLSTSAFNALLKTLEEPPAHVIFILATTEIHKLPATVLSRCQRYEFRRIPVQTIIDKLKVLTQKEKIKIDDDALSLVSRQATGSMRDAISLVDQLSSVSKKITLANAQEMLGTASNQAVQELVDALIAQDSAKGLTLLRAALDGGADPRQFARQVVDHLRNLLVIKLDGGKALELLAETRKIMELQAKSFSNDELVRVISLFSEAATDPKTNWQPGLSLELAYASALNTPPAPVQTPAKPAPTQTVREPIKQPVASQAEPTPEAKPAAAKPEPEPARAVIPGEPLTLELVRGQWDNLRQALRKENPVASALINSSRLIDAQGDTIVLNFNSELLRDRMLDEKNLKPIKRVFEKLFGQEISFACLTGQQNPKPALDYEPGGLVDITRKELGGKVRKVEKRKKEEKSDG